MESVQNIVEYYDEFFPADEQLLNFFSTVISSYAAPARLLSIASNTGTLEMTLAQKNCDITGLEVLQPFLETSVLKRRTQLMSIRFFRLSTVEMGKFLGKDFYHIIYCLNNRIAHIHSQDCMEKFFEDCHALLQNGGVVILQVHNYEKLSDRSKFTLTSRKSTRATLSTDIHICNDKKVAVTQMLETDHGKTMPVITEEEVFPLARESIMQFGKKAGFTEFNFYSDFQLTPFTGDAENLISIIR